MIAQQTAVDTISNNIANVNTVGFKTEKSEFKSLLYQTLQAKTTTANGENKPISAQVGLGTRVASITSRFTQGSLLDSTSDTAFAIDGDGFFAVRGEDGQTYYTRNGDFTWAVAQNGGMMLANADGLPVLDTSGNPIILGSQYEMSQVTVSKNGDIMYPDDTNNPQNIGIQIGLYQFSNPAGLDKLADSLYQETAASGQVINEATNNNIKKSSVVQGYLEGSNVQVVDEMVNLIVAQRAYEMNSKAIQAADEMLEQANSLRR
jgi:flagellar basal-body rod protein FlgG